MTFLTNELFLIALTFGFYLFAKIIQKKKGIMLFNPILITVACLIFFLKLSGIDYETYRQSGQFIEFWLKPAVVALGVPLYQQLESIKKQLLPIVLSQLAGCFIGIFSVVLLAQLLGAGRETILSLASKSVTTPIAMEITSAVGGLPALTAAVVVCVGLFGAVAGFYILKLFKINTDEAQGLSMGAAAHAVGTDRAMSVSRKHGAFAGLGLIVNGIFTAIFTPIILKILGYI